MLPLTRPRGWSAWAMPGTVKMLDHDGMIAFQVVIRWRGAASAAGDSMLRVWHDSRPSGREAGRSICDQGRAQSASCRSLPCLISEPSATADTAPLHHSLRLPDFLTRSKD